MERGRRAAGHEGGDPRLQLRRAVRRDDRLLPRARRVRPGDDGHDAERRADGAEGRGVRLARQDVRDRGGRAPCAWSTPPATTLLEHDVEAGRHLARVPDQGRGRSRDWVKLAVERARATGCARRVLARRDARARRRGAREGRGPYLDEHDTDGLQIEILPVRRGDALHARARPRAARTRSRSPATSCATT